jgi:transposase
MVRNWRKYGYQICNFRGKSERKYWYTDEMKKYILDRKTLAEWAPYSLSYRVLLIEQKYGVKIHKTSLGLFYRKHKVTCRKPQYTY